MRFWRKGAWNHAPYIMAVLLAWAGPALAVQPDEMLADPALEARARNLSQGLRCLVCQNENIDDSDAQLAGDLRVLLRERILAGDTDEQAVAFIVDRYGEYVLLNPPAKGINLALWLAGPGLLVLGGGVAYAMLRRRSGTAGQPPLSAEEEARLAEILKK
jgi:cytochrome c-type biogenesis protein CcmH